MKKTAVILLLLIYGSATMGATVHMHYCMNEFVSWSLLHSKDDICGRCGMGFQDVHPFACADSWNACS
jgi:hypothetical protein